MFLNEFVSNFLGAICLLVVSGALMYVFVLMYEFVIETLWCE